MALPVLLFLYICFDSFVYVVGFGRAAFDIGVKEAGAVADAEFAGFAAISLANADFFVEVVKDAFFFQTG